MTASARRARLALATVRAAVAQPPALTLALTFALAAGGVVLSLNEVKTPLIAAPAGATAAVGLVALTIVFFLTELGQALVEVRRHAYSFSLAGIPMVLGLLYCPPRELIAARICAALAAFAVQRSSPLKASFNTASYLLDTALVLAVSHWFLGEGNGLTLRTAALTYVSLALVDTLMSLLVLLVIRINQGPVSRNEAAEVLLPAAAFVFIDSGVGFIAAFLVSGGALGVVMLGLFALMTAVVYRGFLVLRRRHTSLQMVHGFIEASGGTGTVEELAASMLVRIRSLIRASRVELNLLEPDGTPGLRVLVDEDGAITVGSPGRRATDRRPAADLSPDEAVLITARTTNAQQRRWLHDYGVHDALIAPLAHAGTLIATDRLGDTTHFTADDLALLQTLAGHLAVALQSRQLVARLRHEATHDVLTGLANRSLLASRMHDALRTATANDSPAVLLLDLDRFKEVNDALGHHVGDELLQVVAARLVELRMPDATVARLGGDEFAVLLPALPDPAGDAMSLAERIVAVLSVPVELPEVTLSTSVSIGVAIADDADTDTDTDLLRHADTAMYAAKAAGTPITIYTPGLDAGRGERLAMLADLHLALERDELELHYQPKLDLALNAVTSVEALARWTHPTLGPIPPDVFIPLAESTGLIEQLTHLVLTKALRQCRSWQDDGLDLTVAVNLSARNVINSELPDQVAVALVDAGLPAQKLILEITESSVMGDPDRTVPTLERLSDIGVTLSLDDFGTGYSSLSYLQRLPVREVKIDRSFVLGMTGDVESHASGVLIRSIISLGSSLGLRIVAEGVETAEALEQLRELGCDIIQGYYIGRPVPADELVNSLMRSGLHTFGPPPRLRD
jgi:diguanylate cyclase (GGDEF)-like protein